MELLETISHKDYKIHVWRDPEPLNPRVDYDNMGTMICFRFHKWYNLGDKHSFDKRNFDEWADLESYLEKECGAVIILPLHLYDHGGITMKVGKFSDGWDSGQVGFIYLTRATILENFGGKQLTKKLREMAEAALCSEVKTYDDYLNGRVYGFTITDPAGADARERGRRYFDKADMICECKQIVDRMAKQSV